MRALIQRVEKASVEVGGEKIAEIAGGLLILLGVFEDDTSDDAVFLAGKCANLRIFEDSDGKMNLSLLDIGGDALVVSQFTLCAETAKGRRPSYSAAARPEKAEPLYELFVREIRGNGVARVETGRFGADMRVGLVNDGPVTLIVETG